MHAGVLLASCMHGQVAGNGGTGMDPDGQAPNQGAGDGNA